MIQRIAPIAIVTLLAFAFAAGGCESTPRHQRPPAPIVAQSKEDLYRNFDKEVTLIGKADSRGGEEGRVIVIGDGTAVRLPEQSRWPKDVSGHTVTARGKLYRVTPSGESGVAAATNDYFTLRGVEWTRGDSRR